MIGSELLPVKGFAQRYVTNFFLLGMLSLHVAALVAPCSFASDLDAIQTFATTASKHGTPTRHVM